MTKQNHIIHKQVLDFILPNEEKAKEIQNEIKEIVLGWINENEDIFDKNAK